MLPLISWCGSVNSFAQWHLCSHYLVVIAVLMVVQSLAYWSVSCLLWEGDLPTKPIFRQLPTLTGKPWIAVGLKCCPLIQSTAYWLQVCVVIHIEFSSCIHSPYICCFYLKYNAVVYETCFVSAWFLHSIWYSRSIWCQSRCNFLFCTC